MRTLASVFILAACGSAPKPAAAPWQQQAAAFYTRVADTLDHANNDCGKIATGLWALEPAARDLKSTLDRAGKKAQDFEPEPALRARLSRDPSPLDTCEHDDNVNFAVAATLLYLTPWEMTPSAGAGGAFAPH